MMSPWSGGKVSQSNYIVNTVMKPADKRGALLPWPSKSYLEEAQRQLNNPQHYKEINHNQIPTLMNKITASFTKWKTKNTDHTNFKYLLPKNSPSTPPTTENTQA